MVMEQLMPEMVATAFSPDQELRIGLPAVQPT
jgi:hypothetical protein